jgi:hypothetical protein
MQGVEVIAYHYDSHDDDEDDVDDEEEQEEHCCSACMDCLGLSWRDFM